MLEPEILTHLFFVSHMHKVSACETFFCWAESVDLQCICKVHLCHKKGHQKYCINIHCQLNQCAFSCVILSCLSVCLRITEWIFLKFDTGKCHTVFSSHFSLAVDHIILPYNLHEDWLVFLMYILSVTLFVFLRVKKYLNKIEGMHQHSYAMHLFPNIYWKNKKLYFEICFHVDWEDEITCKNLDNFWYSYFMVWNIINLMTLYFCMKM